MNPKRRAATIGVGGTLAAYLLGYFALRLTLAINPQADPLPLLLILTPLLPGMIPGGLIALPFGGFHSTSFAVGCLISAPIVNAYFVYLWMKWRIQAEKSKGPTT
jgi:hypothetical protein